LGLEKGRLTARVAENAEENEIGIGKGSVFSVLSAVSIAFSCRTN